MPETHFAGRSALGMGHFFRRKDAARRLISQPHRWNPAITTRRIEQEKAERAALSETTKAAAQEKRERRMARRVGA